MKFSRNPISGQMEIYTDDGVYLGIMSTMGDSFINQSEEQAEDGGPGSGNWGHKGRPGKRGGSGPGGGNQYRGGKADIGYFSSRKDWMNGLSGESQHKAARFIASAKKDYQTKLAVKNKLHDLYRRGMLTVDEVEQRAKEAKVDKVTENMSPEEYIMKAGSKEDREALLNHIQGGRAWKENANKLIQTNWDENDKKIAAVLADKYGRAFVGGAEIPDDSAAAKEWEPADLRYWEDLKAKAMEVPTSGEEAPDELQYAAGLKERPAAFPTNDKENKAWIDKLDQHSNDFKEIHRIMNDVFHADLYNFAGRPNMNECEQMMILRMSTFPSEYRISEAQRYLELKDKCCGGSFFKAAQQTLDTSGKEGFPKKKDLNNAVLAGFLKDLAEEEKDRTGYDNNVAQIGDILESSFLMEKEVPKEVKISYLTLKAHAMGMPVDGIDIAKHADRLQNYRTERSEAHKREEIFKNMSPEERVKLRYPKSVAGAARRPEGDMNFEQADEGKTNPNYTPRSNYSKNCQTCVIAYEMRRRGYDVQAKGRNSGVDEWQDKVARNQNTAWIDPNTGKPPEFVKIERPLRNRNMARRWLEDTIKPGERYTFSFCWKDAAAAHVIIAQRDSDGQLMLFDPQIRPDQAVTKGDAITDYLGQIRVNSTTGGNWRPKLLRIDNALPNMDFCDKILLKSN